MVNVASYALPMAEVPQYAGFALLVDQVSHSGCTVTQCMCPLSEE